MRGTKAVYSQVVTVISEKLLPDLVLLPLADNISSLLTNRIHGRLDMLRRDQRDNRRIDNR
jgi:hypothetical protein